MPKYTVYYHTTASFGIEVEAEDESEAMDKADRQIDKVGFPTLCAHCSGAWNHYNKFENETPGIELGEWEPVDSEDGIYEHKD